MAQTFTDWEAICVDDGSTDGSGAILDEYAEKDKRIMVIHQPNAGVSAARNRALDVCVGKWIGFVDGDDVIWNAWFEKWKECIDRYPAVDILRFKTQRWFGGEFPVVDSGENCSVYKTHDEVLDYMKSCVRGFTSWIYVFRRNQLEGHYYPQCVKINEDVLFISEILFAASSLCVCSCNGYYYRVRTGSAIQSGVQDEDMVVFLDGLARNIGKLEKLDMNVAVVYKAWSGKRIVIDLYDCFLSKGVRPAQSIAKVRKLKEDGLVSINATNSWQKIFLAMLMNRNSLPYMALYVWSRLRWRVADMRRLLYAK